MNKLPTMNHSTEYRPTPFQVKRALRALKITQTEAARATRQSNALVSMVLNRKALSQPCLEKLAAFIASRRAPATPETAHAG